MDDSIYVRVNYRGFIGLLKHWGPIPHSYLPKDTVINLIKEGYDVEILSAEDCPEFAKEAKELVEKMKSEEFKANVDENTLLTGGSDDNISGITDPDTEIINPDAPGAGDIVKESIDAVLGGDDGSHGNPDASGVNPELASQMSELDGLEGGENPHSDKPHGGRGRR